jgi:disulfide bond formation protein DsbB
MGIFLTSLLSQFFFDKIPCQLCLISRYLFLLISFVALFSINFKRLKPLLLLLTFSALLFSFYHLGVENHWWIGPQSCVSKLPTLDSLSDNNDQSMVIPYCDRANWKIFGISSTLWSFLVFAFLFWSVSLLYVIDYYLKKLENGN